MNDWQRALEEMDIPALRAGWAAASPHLPQPSSDGEATLTAHMARTSAESIPLKLRAYSHAWLTERGYPSQLPDHLKPAAEKLYPKPLYGVGIIVGTASAMMKPALKLIRESMEYAVLEAEGDGKLLDAAHVKTRMMEARAKTIDKLFG